MLVQPVNIKSFFLGDYVSVASSLCMAYLIGVGAPCLIFGANQSAMTLMIIGIILTLVFVSLAFLSAVLTRDKAKAIGIALLFWFYSALIYDGLLLWVVYNFSDYPLEKVTLGLIALNPVDLARIIMLMQLDISALMGYTGAFYKEFFGSILGNAFANSILILWVIVPLWLAARIFAKKDL